MKIDGKLYLNLLLTYIYLASLDFIVNSLNEAKYFIVQWLVSKDSDFYRRGLKKWYTNLNSTCVENKKDFFNTLFFLYIFVASVNFSNPCINPFRPGWDA